MPEGVYRPEPIYQKKNYVFEDEIDLRSHVQKVYDNTPAFRYFLSEKLSTFRLLKESLACKKPEPVEGDEADGPLIDSNLLAYDETLLTASKIKNGEHLTV